MNIRKRKPIYRETTSYFFITYEYVSGDRSRGIGNACWSVTHHYNQDAHIDYGLVIQNIREYLGEKAIVNNIKALPASKESIEKLFKEQD